jgi:cullin 1
LVPIRHHSSAISHELLLVTLGINERNLNAVSLEVYQEHFESPFLMATEKYYKIESDTFLAQKPLSGYLKRAEQRLREEEDRAERYLNAETHGTVSLLSTS